MTGMMPQAFSLTKPGLFITGTDTGVGKTVVSCAIATALRRQGRIERVGVCKPFATGCRRTREGLVSEDAEALAHFADCRQPLPIINPIRFAAALAPAVAAEQAGRGIDWPELVRCLGVQDTESDVLLVEGVGGVMVPLDPTQPRVTVLDLAASLDYPVVVVARSGLGTLNHTAMTVRLLEGAGCRVAGLVMNGYDADEARSSDVSMASNRTWLGKLTGVEVLAVVPRVEPVAAAVGTGRLDAAVIEAVAQAFWAEIVAPPRSTRRRHGRVTGRARHR